MERYVLNNKKVSKPYENDGIIDLNHINPTLDWIFYKSLF